MKKVIYSDQAPEPAGAYSQAIRTGNLLFTAGQVPIDPNTGELVQGGIEEQTQRVMENLKAVLEEAGTNFTKVVKATAFLDDMADFPDFNKTYADYFPSDPPARSAFQVGALPLGAKLEIEMIAIIE